MATKKIKLPNDYERMIPEYHRNTIIYGEHVIRYMAAQGLVKDKVVLDIASGSGYGTLSLAQTAKKVFGVDVLKGAVEYSRQNYGAANIEYIQGDGVKIPLSDDTVDVVVSFETIEHIENYKAFIAEVKRVLRPDGIFLLSTPNDIEFAEGNHFHIHEFEYAELKSLIQEYFTHTKEYFQGDWIYSGIHPKHEITAEWDKKVRVLSRAALNLDQSLYFFILCSNREITESILSFGALSEHWSARSIQYKKKLTDQHIDNLINKARETERSMQQEIDTLKERLDRIHNTLAWKVLSKATYLKNKFLRKS